jgi:pimeloyl-ACP methyl ester carboxylesterase
MTADAIMTDIGHRFVETNGIRMHIAEQGKGPLVLLCHGFPESWYSWRHQLHALAAAGYHAVAPDQRGYGQTDQPERIEQYTMLHLVGDMVGLLDALGEETAVIAGHDWGAPVAWNAAMMRPDRFRGVIGLSVPYTPRAQASPIASLRRAMGPDDDFYMLYFQEPGVAEAELERDPVATVRRFLYAASGDAPPNERWRPEMRKGQPFLAAVTDPKELPPWLTETDIEFYADEFRRTGFRGGLNWYRTLDLNWELMGPYKGARVSPPALFVAGERDAVLTFPGMDQRIHGLTEWVPNLRKTVLLPGCGHWTQQERSAEVNAEMIAFLQGL